MEELFWSDEHEVLGVKEAHAPFIQRLCQFLSRGGAGLNQKAYIYPVPQGGFTV
jgi:hypothetical protein